jgi:hypothetical protein
MLVCFFIFAREAAGASSARHSLRPLILEGGLREQLGRYLRGENAQAWMPRDGISASPHREERIFARLEP